MACILKIIKQGDLFKVLLRDDNKGVQFCKFDSLFKERVLAYCYGFCDASDFFVQVIDSTNECISDNVVNDLPY